MCLRGSPLTQKLASPDPTLPPTTLPRLLLPSIHAPPPPWQSTQQETGAGAQAPAEPLQLPSPGLALLLTLRGPSLCRVTAQAVIHFCEETKMRTFSTGVNSS